LDQSINTDVYPGIVGLSKEKAREPNLLGFSTFSLSVPPITVSEEPFASLSDTEGIFLGPSLYFSEHLKLF